MTLCAVPPPWSSRKKVGIAEGVKITPVRIYDLVKVLGADAGDVGGHLLLL